MKTHIKMENISIESARVVLGFWEPGKEIGDFFRSLIKMLVQFPHVANFQDISILAKVEVQAAIFSIIVLN
jgi:hypothetical protein